MDPAHIDPRLLQLAALGTQGDPYLPDGRHLRWLVHPSLGFPRTGFRLRRRPSLLPWEAEVVQALGVLRRQRLDAAAVSQGVPREGDRIGFGSGLTAGREGGLAFLPVPLLGEEFPLLDETPLVLDLEPPPPVPPLGPGATDPAAWVALLIARPAATGSAAAEGFFDPREEPRPAGRAELPPDPAAKDEWRLETLVLHGGLLERLVVTGREAALVEVQWVSTRDYSVLTDWQTVEPLGPAGADGRFFLPLTGGAHGYPAWTTAPGDEVARQRLLTLPPRTLPAWEQPAPDLPPPAATPAQQLDHATLRYLGDTFLALEDSLREILEREAVELLPQCRLENVETLVAAESPHLPSVSTYRPFELLVSAAADPGMARLLGLATTDASPAGSEPYDYTVDADFPDLWVRHAMDPQSTEELLKELRDDDVRPAPVFLDNGTPGPAWQDLLAGRRCLSLATGVSIQPAPLPAAPQGLAATPSPAPGLRPVPVQVALRWTADTAHLFFALRRSSTTSPASDVLNPADPDLPLRLPVAITAGARGAGQSSFVDRHLPATGVHAYRVSGMDLWGRFSAWATASVQVRDQSAPPPPTGVQAELVNKSSIGARWQSLRVTWDYPDQLLREAPDLHRFRVRLRQGRLPAESVDDATAWWRFEHKPGATAGPVIVDWPSLLVRGAPAGLSVKVEAAPLAGSGKRFTCTIGPVDCPYDADGFAQVSATVSAEDPPGNMSALPLPGVAVGVDPAVPEAPLLPFEIQWASAPDARNLSSWVLPLATPQGSHASVVRAHQEALLLAGGTDRATWEALDEAGRADHLRQLAALHPEAFRLETETPLDHQISFHRLSFPGGDRGWSVVAVVPTGRTGRRSPWPASPGAFAVVAVPRAELPPVPLLEEIRPLDGTVRLRIAPDLSGVARTLRVYRTRFTERSGDVRRMRPVLAVELPPAGSPEAAEPLVLEDSTVHPYRTYIYRVLAESADGRRSAATIAATVRTWTSAPPEPGEVLEIARPAGAPVRLRLRIPRPDYAVELWRRGRHQTAWERAGDGPLDLAGLPAAGTPAEVEIVLDDPLPALPEGVPLAYRLRIRDPAGRIRLGPPLREESWP